MPESYEPTFDAVEMAQLERLAAQNGMTIEYLIRHLTRQELDRLARRVLDDEPKPKRQ